MLVQIKKMTHLPRRTKLTKLTNDELLVLDFIIMLGKIDSPFWLRQSEYSKHMNGGYTHNIQDENIEVFFTEMTSKGLIVKSTDGSSKENVLYNVTEQGAKLWEIERTPLWNKYCEGSSYYDEQDGQLYFEITSIQKDVGLLFAETALECGLYNFDLMELKPTTPDFFYEWKDFEKIYTFRAPMKENDNLIVDWKLYENKRDWWRNLKELQSLL